MVRHYLIVRSAKAVARRFGVSPGSVELAVERAGIPLRGIRGMSDEARFWEYVIPEPMSGCWLWVGGEKNGYGYFHPRDPDSPTGFGTTRAYRWSYSQYVGPIPDGYEVHHKCYNRPCVNPDHLAAITKLDNLLDSPNTLPGAAIRKTHCKHGHEFTPENTAYNKKGHRHCRTCQRLSAQRSKAKAESRFPFFADNRIETGEER